MAHAASFESTVMLSMQLSDWQKLLPQLHCHSSTATCAPAGRKIIVVLGIGKSLSSLCPADGLLMSHQQDQYFPIGLKWVSVLVV